MRVGRTPEGAEGAEDSSGPPARSFAAVLLAGGRGSRLGGVDKPTVTVHGRTLLDLAVAAVAGASQLVVVGPPRVVGRSVIIARENPPGGGPAAALSAGVAALAAAAPMPPDALVVVCATDLPGLRVGTVERLLDAMDTVTPAAFGPVGAVLQDSGGREQLLIGVWRAGELAAACGSRPDWSGVSLRTLLAPLVRLAVRAAGDEALDVDLPADLERWRRRAGEA